jgi:hypothetical protein
MDLQDPAPEPILPMQECTLCRGTGWARIDRRLRPRLDPAALPAAIAQVERQLQELDTRSADLKQHLGWLRRMIASRPA